jgi:hypothetical protein
MNLTGKGGFKAGVTGNAGGRPKAVAEVRALARAHCPVAIKELARLASKAKSETARIAAIRELLDRGYGKAVQAEGDIGAPIVIQFTKEEMA